MTHDTTTTINATTHANTTHTHDATHAHDMHCAMHHICAQCERDVHDDAHMHIMSYCAINDDGTFDDDEMTICVACARDMQRTRTCDAFDDARAFIAIDHHLNVIDVRVASMQHAIDDDTRCAHCNARATMYVDACECAMHDDETIVHNACFDAHMNMHIDARDDLLRCVICRDVNATCDVYDDAICATCVDAHHARIVFTFDTSIASRTFDDVICAYIDDDDQTRMHIYFDNRTRVTLRAFNDDDARDDTTRYARIDDYVCVVDTIVDDDATYAYRDARDDMRAFASNACATTRRRDYTLRTRDTSHTM